MTEGHVLDDGAVRLEFLATGADTTGREHVMRATYRPGTPFAPTHLHPAQEETFQVTDGQLHVVLDGQDHTVRAGESIVIPPGSVHQVRNAADEPAEAIWTTRPALRTADFLRALAAAKLAGDVRGLGSVLDEYQDVFVVDQRTTPAPQHDVVPRRPSPTAADLLGLGGPAVAGAGVAVLVVIVVALVLIFSIARHWL